MKGVGVMENTKPSTSRAEILERYRRGIALEKEGLNYSEISKALGYRNIDSYRKLKQKIETNGVYTRTVSRNRDGALERYNKGIALESNGMSEKDVAYRLGYTWLSSWRQLKSRFGGPKRKSITPDNESITEQTVTHEDLSKERIAKLSELGDKALRWLSPKQQSIETVNAILDLLIEEANREGGAV